jgi:hypothetical protein
MQALPGKTWATSGVILQNEMTWEKLLFNLFTSYYTVLHTEILHA